MLSTLKFAWSLRPSNVLMICFGCPRRPLLQRSGQSEVSSHHIVDLDYPRISNPNCLTSCPTTHVCVFPCFFFLLVSFCFFVFLVFLLFVVVAAKVGCGQSRSGQPRPQPQLRDQFPRSGYTPIPNPELSGQCTPDPSTPRSPNPNCLASHPPVLGGNWGTCCLILVLCLP